MNGLENAQKANFTEVEKTKETFNLNELEVTALEESELKDIEGGLITIAIGLGISAGFYYLTSQNAY